MPSRFEEVWNRALFASLSQTGRGLRKTLLSFATGTRGSNVVYYQAQAHLASGRIALTIDDAPSRSIEHFTRLLDMLAHLEVKVSFQVIYEYASDDEHLALLQRAVSEGHQLVNHSTCDEPCTGCSREEFRTRLQTCQQLIERLVPGTRKWFRPPSGLMNDTMRSVCLEEGFMVCMGDSYSADPQVHDVTWHVDTLFRQAEEGSVVIIHCPEPGIREQSLDIIPRLVEELRSKKGFGFVTLDQLFPQDRLSRFTSFDSAQTAPGLAAAKQAIELTKAQIHSIPELKNIFEFENEPLEDQRTYEQQIKFEEEISVDGNGPRMFLIAGGKGGSKVHVALNRSSTMAAHQEGCIVISDGVGTCLHKETFRSDRGGMNWTRDIPGAQVVTLSLASHHFGSGLFGGLGVSSTSTVVVSVA